MSKWYQEENLTHECPDCGGLAELHSPPNHLYPASYKCYNCYVYGYIFHVGEPEEPERLPVEESFRRLGATNSERKSWLWKLARRFMIWLGNKLRKKG